MSVFFNSFVSLETNAPSLYKKAHSLSPLDSLYPNLFHFLSSFFLFWAMSKLQVQAKTQSCSCPGLYGTASLLCGWPATLETLNGLSSTGTSEKCFCWCVLCHVHVPLLFWRQQVWLSWQESKSKGGGFVQDVQSLSVLWRGTVKTLLQVVWDIRCVYILIGPLATYYFVAVTNIYHLVLIAICIHSIHPPWVKSHGGWNIKQMKWLHNQ